MTTEYNNRYRDKIYFTDNGDGTVTMDGGKYLRYGFDEEPYEVNMVDPSGGPYIEIGNNLKSFFHDGVDRIVESIKILERNGEHADSFDEPISVLFGIKNEI
jgi:hypothetical protein